MPPLRKEDTASNSPRSSSPQTLKDEGNEAFKAGDIAEAISKYTAALAVVNSNESGGEKRETGETFGKDNGGEDVRLLSSTLLSNRAACFLKLNNLDRVIKDCDGALEADQLNKKARFRRAEAMQRLGKTDEALRDMHVLCQQHPDSREFRERARDLRNSLQEKGGQHTLLSTIEKFAEFEGLGKSEKEALFGTIESLAHKSEIDSEAFCCKGGLDALLKVGKSDEQEYFTKACYSIGTIGAASVGSATLCLAFLRERFDQFGFGDGGELERKLSSFLRMHNKIGCKLAECGKLTADQLAQVLRAHLHALDCAPRELKGVCVKQMLLCKVEGFWEMLLHEESFTVKIVKALLCGGYSSRQLLLHLIGIAREVLGIEKLKEQILSIMTGKALSQGLELSALESALLIEALFVLMPGEGGWLLNTTPAYQQVLEISRGCEDEVILKILSSILSQLASNKEGQEKFREPEIQGLLAQVAKREDFQTKANSLLVLAKIANNESDHRDDEGIALEALMVLQRVEIVEKKMESDAFLELVTNLVEVLVFTVEDSNIKDHIAEQLLDANIVRLLSAKALSHATLSFGLSRVFSYVLATGKEIEMVPLLTEAADEDQTARKIASQMLNKQQSETREDTDTPARCSNRKVAFVEAEGVHNLLYLARAGSLETKVHVAAALFHCSSEQAVRPQMVQQGALTLIMKLLRDDDDHRRHRHRSEEEKIGDRGNKCKLLASHALARILISINPGLLDEMQVVEFVTPLLLLVGRDYALQQFEGLLALTNLATVGLEIQEKIVGKGFTTIEELQWSNNQMVVRAATELFCNCVSCDKVLSSIKDESRQKLWLSLAHSEDQPLALASAGALAMASGDRDVSIKLVENGSFSDFVELAKSNDQAMQHRACVTLQNLTQNHMDCTAKLNVKLLQDLLAKHVVRKGPARDSLERAIQNLTA